MWWDERTIFHSLNLQVNSVLAGKELFLYFRWSIETCHLTSVIEENCHTGQNSRLPTGFDGIALFDDAKLRRSLEFNISRNVAPWCSGYDYCTTSFTKPEFRFCASSNPSRGMSEIRGGEDLWQWSRLEIRLSAFRRSTIPQKQFIIIFIIIII